MAEGGQPKINKIKYLATSRHAYSAYSESSDSSIFALSATIAPPAITTGPDIIVKGLIAPLTNEGAAPVVQN